MAVKRRDDETKGVRISRRNWKMRGKELGAMSGYYNPSICFIAALDFYGYLIASRHWDNFVIFNYFSLLV